VVSETWQKLLSTKISAHDPLSAALRRKGTTGAPGASEAQLIANGDGWRVADIVCTHGPADHPFEEQFGATSISIVLAGNFVYRSARGVTLMAPGSLMLGNAGRSFECSHQHGEGDRCLSFQFEPDLFERIARETGSKRAMLDNDYLAPNRELSRLTARAIIAAKSAGRDGVFANRVLEEIAVELAGIAIPLASHTSEQARTNETRDAGRIARLLRQMECHSDEAISVADLAREAGLSRYHFLRTFKRVTGITPHQWLVRARLLSAAERLAITQRPVTEIALDVGFDDLSNFIRSFRAVFGISPRRYRAAQ
jgi:AraC family transcriptional regulator